jgi:hypothetical protein
VKPDINSVEVHPSLRPNRHPMDGILMGASGFTLAHLGSSIPLQPPNKQKLFLPFSLERKERKGKERKGKVEGQLG